MKLYTHMEIELYGYETSYPHGKLNYKLLDP